MSSIYEDSTGQFWAIGYLAEAKIVALRKLPTTSTQMAIRIEPHAIIMAAAKLIADKVTEDVE